MSKKKLYKNMPKDKLLSIKRLTTTELKRIRENILFDKRYGSENLFDSKHLKKDDLMSKLRNVEEAIELNKEKENDMFK